jgi:hypothetical protein
MANYYYLIAQLPYLELGQTPPFGEDYFLSEAAKWLDAKDYRCLRQIKLETIDALKTSSDFLKKYQQLEQNIRGEIYHYRQARAKGGQYKMPSWLDTIIKQANPLEQEKGLLRLRWNFIDNLALQYHFNFDAVSIYYLKLKLVHRFALFTKEKGSEVFNQGSDFYLDQKEEITKYNN